MQCKNHPHKNAEHICSGCSAPLCDECVEEVRPGVYACFQCAMLQSVSAVSSDLTEKRKRADERKIARRKKWGPFQYFTIVSAVLILVMWGVILFGGKPAPVKGETGLGKGKAGRVLLFLVDSALKRYAHYEANAYPERLAELVPKYLQLKGYQISSLDKLSYRRNPDPKLGYRLTLAHFGRGQMKIVLTPTGIEYTQTWGGEPK